MIAFLLHREASSRAARIGALAGLVAALAVADPSSASAQDITGQWLTDEGEGVIEIRPCGENRCGRIVWMKNPKGPDGKPPTDVNNPDPKLRSRTICGLQIISDLKPQADGSWGDGRVYNPRNGQSYGMTIRRDGADVIQAKGYLGFELLGQTREWKRAPKNIGTCDEALKRS